MNLNSFLFFVGITLDYSLVSLYDVSVLKFMQRILVVTPKRVLSYVKIKRKMECC
ncbi:MAG: hypothetical protein BROFUL_01636 [Candidatus Brocadia fulgida]|jgi:hypothetical protein|uniref:Uncharacterized protein n=1 Tax=Candidatus Brocadia fulgida TaxID=380242 RepID=A0A0M2UUD7_9BACT|nr:MAG: hypothetical protein BROFUL_01636 [Candidatus Brocadia fulgida]